MFKGFFKKLGADLVLDLKFAEDLALLESQSEFIERYKSAKTLTVQKVLPMLASSCPGITKNIKYSCHYITWCIYLFIYF